MSIELRNSICDSMATYYQMGWCSGSGGGMSVRDVNAGTILMAPSGVAKQELKPDDLFELEEDACTIRTPPTNKDLCLSQCAPLFRQAYVLRKACGVLHSHAMEALLVTRLCEDEFRMSGMEMIKGVPGHKNTDTLVVPIIENTENESELTERLRMAIEAYPRTHAVLVRNHGVYVWGPSPVQTRTIAECYHYLFQAKVELTKLGMEPALQKPEPVPQKTTSKPRAWRLPIQNDSFNRKAANNEMEQWVDWNTLEKLGVSHQNINPADENEVSEYQNVQGYDSKDQVTISKAVFGNDFEIKCASFFKEHFHADDEVRIIVKGSGYFDVRDGTDWIRMQVGAGDAVVLPEGILHRFTVDRGEMITAIRLFKGKPVWTALERDDAHASRQAYVEKIQAA